LIPPGVARFTRWNEPAEFIPLHAPSDAGLPEKEIELEEKWKELLCQPAEDDDRFTAVTASMSSESSWEHQVSGQPPEMLPFSWMTILMESAGPIFLMMMKMTVPVHHTLRKTMSLEKELKPHCMQWSFLGIA